MAAIWGYAEPLRILCTREFQMSIKDSFHAELKVAIATEPWLEAAYDVGVDYLRGKNGTEFIFRGLRNSIKSLAKIDLTIVEEAEDLRAAAWLDLEATVFRQPKSEMWVIWNPSKDGSPVDERFVKNCPPNALITEMNWSDNPFFPKGLDTLRRREQQRLDAGTYNHVWEGQYLSRSKSQVFQNWRVDEFEAPQGTIFYFGSDWGYSVDPSVLVRAFIIGRTIFIDHEAYAVGCEIDKLPFLFAGCENEEIINKNLPAYQALTRAERDEWKGVPGSTTAPIRADSQRPDTISYMKRHGFSRIVASTKGPGSVEDGIEFIKSYDVVIHPRCKNTIREFTNYSYKVDPHTDEVTNVLADKENHVIDSVRYAVEQVRRKTRTTSRELGI